MNKFNIRVYGIVQQDDKILLCDEVIGELKMTKFVGGGLEFGEGTVDCLKREFLEETGKSIEVLEHVYTTDFFQQSAFSSEQQLLSIYYRVRFSEAVNFPNQNLPSYIQRLFFRWADIHQLNENDLTFPIDRILLRKIKES